MTECQFCEGLIYKLWPFGWIHDYPRPLSWEHRAKPWLTPDSGREADHG